MPTNDPRPTKAQRRDEARAKALQMRQEQERRARRTKILTASLLVVVVAAVAVVVGITIRNNAETEAKYGNVVYGGNESQVVAPKLADVTAPSTANDKGGIPVSAAGVGEQGEDDVVVTVFFDFMCPYCGMFDTANAADLKELAATDGVTIDYRVVSFLDGQSKGTSFSTRAANALAVVADKSPEQVQDFITALYEKQPKEGTTGLTDDEIADLAVGVGVPQDVADTFTDTVDGTFEVGEDAVEKTGEWRTFAPWVSAATHKAQTDRGAKFGTPTVLIDGQEWPGEGEDKGGLYQQGPLRAAVEAALAAKG
ncbi:DsbA family protein [Cellulomonas palmilytica]|uniref:DsbA family protein n=1 Tax=Cellulomonas palmilytica TaxID=2608402 RepID=UPI001F1AD580|nr:thioredoxin domain-containing protein [Cellulomonas palmilytica]UJP40948.1 thioredoxin domain-containing protein [Cellulomonas palmilytica]